MDLHGFGEFPLVQTAVPTLIARVVYIWIRIALGVLLVTLVLNGEPS